MRSASVALALLIALLLTRTLVASEEPPPGLRTLQPGDNPIGWVSYPVTAEELFEQIPDADRISAWDARLSRYRHAEPAESSEGGVEGDLSVIQPGMGLFVRIAGERAVEWIQPIAADGEQLTLRRGSNLLAWTGPSDTPIDLATRSIGESFISAHYWIPETEEFGVFDPETTLDDQNVPKLRRGDALWVVTTSTSSWLQPSGNRPLHPLGPPSDAVRWYRSFDKHLDADGVAFVSTDQVADEALFRAAAILDEMLVNRPDIRDALIRRRIHVVVIGKSEQAFDLAPFRRFRDHPRLEDIGPFGPRGLGPTQYSPTLISEDDLLCLGHSGEQAQDVAVHEFAHMIDYAISRGLQGGGFRSSLATAYRAGIDSGHWDGTYGATNSAEFWAEGVQAWFGLKGDFAGTFSTRSDLIRYAPELADLISETLGEFDLHATCHAAAARQQGATRKALVSGNLLDQNGEGLANARVQLEETTGDPNIVKATSWPDGGFRLFARPGEYTIRALIDGCRVFYSNAGPTLSFRSADVIDLADEDVQVEIRLSDQACLHQATGTVIGSNGRPLVGITVAAIGASGQVHATPSSSGEFRLRFPDAGPHNVLVYYRDCFYVFDGDQLINEPGRNLKVDPATTAQQGLDLRLPSRACEWQIRGRIVDEDGAAIQRASVGALVNWLARYRRVNADGSFVAAVNRPGMYRLIVIIDGCVGFVGANGVKRAADEAIPFEVGEQGLSMLEIVIPPELCGS